MQNTGHPRAEMTCVVRLFCDVPSCWWLFGDYHLVGVGRFYWRDERIHFCSYGLLGLRPLLQVLLGGSCRPARFGVLIHLTLASFPLRLL